MTPQENIDLLIQKSLKGKLSAEEQAYFDALKQNQPNIQQQIEEQRMLSILVNESKLIDVKNLAVKAHNKATKRDEIIKKSFIVGGIVTIVLLGIAVIWYMNTPKLATAKPADHTNTSKHENISEVKKEANLTSLANTTVGSPKRPLVHAEKEIPNTNSTDSAQKQMTYGVQQETKIASISTTAQNPKTISTITTIPRQDSVKASEPCKNVSMKAEFSIQATCKNEQMGSIALSQCSGGDKPYHFKVYDIQHNLLHDYMHLEAGDYKVIVYDAKSCNTLQELSIPEKPCQSHHTFNPFIEETWETPKKDKKGHLKIVDKKGNIYFSRNLAPAEVLFWNGKSNNGDIKSGYYLFYIQYEDNSMTNGTVTIIE